MIFFKKITIPLFLIWLAGGAILAQDLEVEPLEEALWEGVLTINVEGPLHSQALSNKLNENGVPVGFTKEKGKMKLSYQLEFRFQVNALGEYTMAVREGFTGEKVLNREFWYMFDEEHVVKKTRVSTRRRVRVSENSEYIYTFNHAKTYTDANFDIGNFRVQPTGRMDKKGVIKVIGEISSQFQGEGTARFVKQRQPASKEYGIQKSDAKAITQYKLPLTFEASIPHKTDTVSVPVQVQITVPVPFYFPDNPEKEPDIFKHTVTASGTVTLKPLFQSGKKKKKKN